MSGFHYRFAPVAGMAVLILIFFWKPIVTGDYFAGTDLLQVIAIHRVAPPAYEPRNILQSDTVLLFFPSHRWSRLELSRGTIPLWNPFNGAGAPHVANYESAIFSPFTIPYFVLPFRLAILVAGFLKLFGLGLFTYLYLRSVGVARGASLFGGVAFGFSGYNIVWLHYTACGTAISMPASLYFIERCVAATLRGSNRGLVANAAGVAASLAVGLLTGHPETYFFCALFVGAYALVRIGTAGRAAAPKLTAALWASCVAAVGLAAIQLLPFFEYLRESSIFASRSTHAPVAFTAARHFALQLFPNLLGSPVEPYYSPNFPGHYPMLTGAFVPLVALVLAPFGVISQRFRRLTIFFIGAAVTWCAYYYNLLDLARSLRDLPLIGVAAPFSSQSIWLFSIACAGSLGVDVLLRDPTWRTMRVLLVWSAAVGMIGFIAQRWYRSAAEAMPASNAGDPLARQQVIVHVSLLAITTILAVLIVVGATKLRFERRWILAVTVTLLAFLQAFVTFSDYTPTVEEKYFYPLTPAFESLLRAANGELTLRLDGTAVPPNVSLWFGVDGVANYDGMGLRHYDRLFTELIRSDHRTTEFEAKPISLQALQLMGIRFVSTTRERPFEPHIPLDPAFRTGPYRLFRVPGALERYMVVPRHAEMSEDQAVEVMRGGSFDPRALVLLDAPTSRPVALPVTPAGAHPQHSGVKVLREDPVEIELAANSSGSGWLLALRTFFPGWRATVNGEPVELRRANVAYMAVPLKHGPNRVRLRYEPRSFYVGAAISGMALVVITVASMLNLPGARRSRSAPTADV